MITQEINFRTVLETTGLKAMQDGLIKGMQGVEQFKTAFKSMTIEAVKFEKAIKAMEIKDEMVSTVGIINDALKQLNAADFTTEGIAKIEQMIETARMFKDQISDPEARKEVNKLVEDFNKLKLDNMEKAAEAISESFSQQVIDYDKLVKSMQEGVELSGEHKNNVYELVKNYSGLLEHMADNNDYWAKMVLNSYDINKNLDIQKKRWEEVKSQLMEIGGPILGRVAVAMKELQADPKAASWKYAVMGSAAAFAYMTKALYDLIEAQESYRHSGLRLAGTINELTERQYQLARATNATTEEARNALLATANLQAQINALDLGTNQTAQASVELSEANAKLAVATGVASDSIAQYQRALMLTGSTTSETAEATMSLVNASAVYGLTVKELDRILQQTNRQAFLLKELFGEGSGAAREFAEGLMLIEGAAKAVGTEGTNYIEQFNSALKNPLDSVMLLGDNLGAFVSGQVKSGTDAMIKFGESADKALARMQDVPPGLKDMMSRQIYGVGIDQLREFSDIYKKTQADIAKAGGREAYIAGLRDQQRAEEEYQKSLETFRRSWVDLANQLAPVVNEILIPALEKFTVVVRMLADILGSKVGQYLLFFGLVTVVGVKFVSIIQRVGTMLGFFGNSAVAASTKLSSAGKGINGFFQSLKTSVPTMLAVGAAMLMMAGSVYILTQSVGVMFTMFKENAGAAAAALGAVILLVVAMIPVIGALGAVGAVAAGPILAVGASLLMMGGAAFLAGAGVWLVAEAFSIIIDAVIRLVPHMGELAIGMLKLNMQMAAAAAFGALGAYGLIAFSGSLLVLMGSLIAFSVASLLFGSVLDDLNAIFANMADTFKETDNMDRFVSTIKTMLNLDASNLEDTAEYIGYMVDYLNDADVDAMNALSRTFISMNAASMNTDFTAMSQFINSLNDIRVSHIDAVAASVSNLAMSMNMLSSSALTLSAVGRMGLGDSINQVAKVTVDSADNSRAKTNERLSETVDVLLSIESHSKNIEELNRSMDDKLGEILSIFGDPNSATLGSPDYMVGS